MVLPLLLTVLVAQSSLDDQAKFMAGLPLSPDSGSPLAARQSESSFVKHAQALDGGWSKLDERRLVPMARWAKEEVAPAVNASLPVVYMFGGPDAITVDVIYPEAKIYVLAGLENPGAVPALDSLTPQELQRGLESLRSAMRTTIDVSFFVTSKVSSDLTRSKVRGVLPVMMLMLARHGDTVLDAELISLDSTGVPKPASTPPLKNGVPGFRLRFLRGGTGEPRELYYFAQDVADSALPARPGLLPFLKSLGPFNSFFKAASFILHDRHFSKVRDAVLESSRSILQDDSGMPYKQFVGTKAKPSPWQLAFYGDYTPMTGEFKDHFQPDLKAAFDAAAAKKPLPFRTGYKHERGSFMMLGTKHEEPAE